MTKNKSAVFSVTNKVKFENPRTLPVLIYFVNSYVKGVTPGRCIVGEYTKFIIINNFRIA